MRNDAAAGPVPLPMSEDHGSTRDAGLERRLPLADGVARGRVRLHLGPGEPAGPGAAEPAGEQLGAAAAAEVEVDGLRVLVDGVGAHAEAGDDLLVAVPFEQAGEDRVLFMNARPQEHVEMRFPECVLPTQLHEEKAHV